MPRAARITDAHKCPKDPPGLVATGSGNVNTGYQAAARVGDKITCGAVIVEGASNVFINGRQAARLGDPTSHAGKIASGCPTVNIGESAQANTLVIAAMSAAPFAEDCPLRGEPPTAEESEEEKA